MWTSCVELRTISIPQTISSKKKNQNQQANIDGEKGKPENRLKVVQPKLFEDRWPLASEHQENKSAPATGLWHQILWKSSNEFTGEHTSGAISLDWISWWNRSLLVEAWMDIGTLLVRQRILALLPLGFKFHNLPAIDLNQSSSN